MYIQGTSYHIFLDSAKPVHPILSERPPLLPDRNYSVVVLAFHLSYSQVTDCKREERLATQK